LLGTVGGKSVLRGGLLLHATLKTILREGEREKVCIGKRV